MAGARSAEGSGRSGWEVPERTVDVTEPAVMPSDAAFAPVIEIPPWTPAGFDAATLFLHAHAEGGRRLAEAIEIEH